MQSSTRNCCKIDPHRSEIAYEMDTRAAEIRASIDSGAALPHQAAAIAMEIFLLSVGRGAADSEVRSLVARFIEILPVWGMPDLLALQMSYAQTLAEAKGQLEYEEMHKLFSLRDEIRAMRTLGLAADEQDVVELDTALRSRFSADPKKARLVAEDRVEGWNRDSWWYAENLKGG